MLTAALELTDNMAILVAMVLSSGWIRRSQESASRQVFLQGLLFGAATLIHMAAPMGLGPGLIFDPLAGHPQVRPAQLEIEILETSALNDLAGVSQLIEDCHRIGVLFALDDFGTGYSSLRPKLCARHAR